MKEKRIQNNSIKTCLVLVLLIMFVCNISMAARRTWNGGGGDYKWNTAANWVGGTRPSSGDILVFGNITATLVNDMTAGTSFNSIVFPSGTVPSLTITGNYIQLSASTYTLVDSTGQSASYVTMSLDSIIFSNNAEIRLRGSSPMDITSNLNIGSHILTIYNLTNTTFSGVIRGTGSLYKNGSGSKTTLILNAANTFTGGIEVYGGKILASSNNAFSTGTITMDAGTTIDADANNYSYANNPMNWNGDFSFGGSGTMNLGTGNIVLNADINLSAVGGGSGRTITFGGIISGAHAITLSGSVSSVNLTNSANTYSGNVAISTSVSGVTYYSTIQNTGVACSFGVGNTISIGSTTNPGTIVFQGTSSQSTNRTIDLAGTTGTATLDISSTSNVTFTHDFTASGVGSKTLTLQGSNTGIGVITGVVVDNGGANITSLTKTGTGTWILSGTNTYTDVTTISGGTLQIGNAGTTGSIAGTSIVNNSNLNFNRSNSYTYSGVISGTGAVTVSSGTVIYTGANTYTGITTIASGATLQIGNAGTTGAIVGNIVNNGTLIFNLSGSYTYAGNISGTGAVQITGGGTITFTGSNSYSGATTVSTGILKLGSTGALSSSSALTVSGTIDLNNNSNSIGSLTGAGTIDNVSAGGSLTLTSGGDNSNTIFSGVIQNTTGTLSLTKSGNGTLTLSGANTYSGLTTISAGILKLNNTAALGTAAGGTTISSGAALDLNGINYATAEPLTLNGTGISSGGALINSNASAATFAGAITLGSSSTITANYQITLSGAISPSTVDFTKAGTNSLVFTSNTISVNNLSISAGTLVGGSSTINIYGNFSNSGTFTPNTNGVNMAGSSGSQAIPAGSFNNLTLNNAAGASLSGDVSVAGTLTLSSGILSTGSHKVDLGTTGSIVEAADPSSYVLGNLAATRNIGTSIGNVTFGGMGAEITETAHASQAATIIRTTGTACSANGKSGIKRYFTITPAISDASLNGTLVFHYFPTAELNGSIETNLKLYKSTDGRVTFSKQSGASLNTGSHTLTLSGISSFSDWTASDGTNESLPIELLSFTAKKTAYTVVLNWITASETNNSYFTLERSTDGIHWTSIYTCDGAGTSTQVHSYSYVDSETIEGTVYYRLKQTDINGDSTNSSIESISMVKDNFSFTVYPNPSVVQDIYIAIKGTRVETATVSIDDITGKHICSGSIEVSTSPVMVKLSDICNNIRPGTYYISIQCGDIVSHKKFIVE